MAAMKRFHVLIPEDDFEWVTQIAEEDSINVSDVIRSAISSYRISHSRSPELEQRQEPYAEDLTIERALARIENLEQFVFKVLPRVQEVPSRLIADIVEYAPGYMLNRPPELDKK